MVDTGHVGRSTISVLCLPTPPLKSGHGHKKIDFRFSKHWRHRLLQMQWFPNRQICKIFKIRGRCLSLLFIRQMCRILKISCQCLSSSLLIRQMRRILKISCQCLSLLLTLLLNVNVCPKVAPLEGMPIAQCRYMEGQTGLTGGARPVRCPPHSPRLRTCQRGQGGERRECDGKVIQSH